MADRVFVVRIWSEQRQIKNIWRGRIEDLSTGERRYFDDLETLMEIISRGIGQPKSHRGKPGIED